MAALAEVQNSTEGESGPTVKAVLAEAARLRERASRERAADCYARPYDPSDDVARKLSQQLGPVPAIDELKRRAADAQAKYREDTERSDRARKRLERQQRLTDAEHRQRLSRMTLGQRLDEAIAALTMVSQVSAVKLDADPVSSSKPGSGSGPAPSDDQAGDLVERALMLVARIEDEVPRAQRRATQRRAAA